MWRLGPYLQMMRPGNLLMVVFTQLIIYHFIINLHIEGKALNIVMQIFLALATALVAAGGYVVNDIFDYKIDQVNKPKSPIASQKISLQQAWRFYLVITGLGFLISFGIAIATDNLKLIFLYPIGVLLLFVYARQLKKNGGLLANIVVSLMIFFVCGLIIIAERKALFTPENYTYLFLISAFGVFALFINLAREIVKDIEDVEGDRIHQTKSLAVVLGVTHAKFLAMFNLLIIVGLTFYFTSLYRHNSLCYWYNSLMVILPGLVVLIRLYKAEDKEDFTLISKVLKGIMLSGLIYLILLTYVE